MVRIRTKRVAAVIMAILIFSVIIVILLKSPYA
jgi:uncharacterized membrane protein